MVLGLIASKLAPTGELRGPDWFARRAFL
ncbi:hypothetical protein EMIT0373P_20062 [Pseudomonas chlororaphis]